MAQALLGDMDGDGVANLLDIDAFVLAIVDAETYETTYPGLYADVSGDCNNDQVTNLLDIDAFVDIVVASAGGGEVQIIPEPASVLWLGLGALAFALGRRIRPTY